MSIERLDALRSLCDKRYQQILDLKAQLNGLQRDHGEELMSRDAGIELWQNVETLNKQKILKEVKRLIPLVDGGDEKAGNRLWALAWVLGITDYDELRRGTDG